MIKNLKSGTAAFFVFILCLILNAAANAKDLNFEAALDRGKTVVGRSVQLNLTFNDTLDIPAIELPAIDGLQARYLGPSTKMSIVNGQSSGSVTHIYTLLPLRAGTFHIGPFSFEYKGNTYHVQAVTLEVGPKAAPQDYRQQLTENGSSNTGDQVFLTIQLKKNTAYLNEVVPLVIKLYRRKADLRDIQYPQVKHDGFFVSEFQQPRQYQEVLNGLVYEVIEFKAFVFALRTGETKFGPADLSCNLMLRQERQRRPQDLEDFFGSNIFDDFFGRYQTHPLSLRSPDITVSILELPQENRPADFKGAIGDFDLEVSAKPALVKTGDPITLTMTVKGEGNFNTVNPPVLNSEDGFKIYEAQARQEPDRKIFEQVIMPVNDGLKEIPVINFSFFNPGSGQYQSLRRGPFPIKVERPQIQESTLKSIETLPAKTPLPQEEKLGRDIIYIKTAPSLWRKKGEYFYNNPLFLAGQLLAPLALLLSFLFERRRSKLRTDARYARGLRAPKKAKEGLRRARACLKEARGREFYDTIFETLKQYLGDKFHLSCAGITAGIVDETLKDKDIDARILNKLRDIFSVCDAARYAVSDSDQDDMRETLKKLEETIDYFQRMKIPLSSPFYKGGKRGT